MTLHLPTKEIRLLQIERLDDSYEVLGVANGLVCFRLEWFSTPAVTAHIVAHLSGAQHLNRDRTSVNNVQDRHCPRACGLGITFRRR